MNKFTSRVFISHSYKDRENVLRLKNELEKFSIFAWCFEEDLFLSKSIENEVKFEIEECDFFIIYLTENSINSDWIKWELGYRKEIIDLRLGEERPKLVPIQEFSDINQFTKDLKIQPLKIGTFEPIGDPINFYELRAHEAKNFEDLPNLINNLLPKFKQIYDPTGRDRYHFSQVVKLGQELYSEFPADEDLIDWINSDGINNNLNIWPEILIALHYQNDVFGFINMTYHKSSEYGFIAYFGLKNAWQGMNHKKLLFSAADNFLIEAKIDVNFLIAEMDYINFIDNKLRAIPLELSFTAPELEFVKNLNFLQNSGFKPLLNPDGTFFKLRNPKLSLPLTFDASESIILVRKINDVEFQMNSELLDWFYERTLHGYGPNGLNLPGYEQYIKELKIKQHTNILPEIRLDRYFIDPAIRKLCR